MSVFDRIKQMAEKNKGNFDREEAIRQVEERRLAAEDEQYDRFKKQFDECSARESIGRSGILPLHQHCRVNNFEATTAEQAHARDFALQYITNFHLNNGGGFIFSGNPGTGKNHLAAAICNELMNRNKSCMVITVTELMQKLRNCYNSGSETTEDQFIRSMIDFDLLILDEIGLQRNSDAEKLALNQIVDQRICRMKPTGMLTNLDQRTINDCLGVRIMDRMRSNGGKWISFNWNSYRK